MSGNGTLTISIDTEIAWGRCDRRITQEDHAALARERAIVQRLLALFSAYNIQATWAIVGHLLLKECSWEGAVVHPEVPRPILSGEIGDWFFQHPSRAVTDDPLWYGRDILELIRNATPPQEIGSHSFCHMPFDERRSNSDAVRADLFAAQELHEAEGLAFDSFIFPRNVVGYRELVASSGLKGYRGNTPHWYDSIPVPPLRRLLSLASFVIPIAPPSVRPSLDSVGLVNIPDSMLLMGRNGLRALISSRALVRKGIAGLQRAVKQGEVFHLWFHPSNFAHRTEEQFQVLENILQHADGLKRRGVLKVRTMGDQITLFINSQKQATKNSSKFAEVRETMMLATEDRTALRSKILAAFHEALEARQQHLSCELSDNAILLETGLDSLGFAILVVKLEEELGYDPFVMMKEQCYPRTLREFIDVYAKSYQNNHD